MQEKLCEKCGRPMIKMYRRYSSKWAGKLLTELKNSKGNVEFNIKSDKYQYCISYCKVCDKLSDL